MKSQTILVPRDQTLEKIIEFVNILSSTPQAEKYVFDFQNPGWVTPFGMLFIGCMINSFIETHPGVEIEAKNHENGYAWHMGFFKACGFDIGRTQEAVGNLQYLPITILPVSELHREAKEEVLEIGQVVEKRSKKLAQVLTQQEYGDLVDMFTYTMREMIRNVIEHSQSDTVAFCAQYMPSTKRPEIAILDTGIGIRASLSNNPHLKLKDDHDALNLALMPGISGKMYKGKKRDPYDPWQNSGYGLYAVSRLCGFGGKFLICSGDTGLSLKPEGKEYHLLKFQGTALRLNLCSKDIKHLQTVLSKIMKDGDLMAKKFQGDENIQASSASRMLSGEFENQSNKK
ncbi:MAG: hypothetical protein ABIL11_01005 [Chloroflexota bacterium]